jgi:hypothetical protein
MELYMLERVLEKTGQLHVQYADFKEAQKDII